MNDLPSWLRAEYADNSITRWATAAGVLLASVVILRVVKALLRRRLSTAAPRTKGRVDDAVLAIVERTTLVFMITVGLWAAALTLRLPELTTARLRSAAVLVALVQAGIWAGAVVTFLTARVGGAQDAAQATGQAVLRFLALTFVWIVVVLLCLDNLGINVTALVAGLGVGGVAVALAVQNILGDLFASISILLDKPFRVGDAIAVGDLTGTVERIGVKTTRVRSLSGEQLVFANSDLLQSRIRNFGIMAERRVVITFGVAADTPVNELARIPTMVREIVSTLEGTRFDRAHVAKLTPAAIEIEVVWFVTTPDYLVHMDRQQAFYLSLLDRLAEAGIAIAVPTQRLVAPFLPGTPPVSE